MTDLPGITSTTRTLIADNERAISLASPLILLTLMPGANSNSNRVITGPGNTAVTFTSTPKSAKRCSTNKDNSSNEILLNGFSDMGGDGFSNDNGGNEPGANLILGSISSLSSFFFSRSGSTLVITTGLGTTTTFSGITGSSRARRFGFSAIIASALRCASRAARS